MYPCYIVVVEVRCVWSKSRVCTRTNALHAKPLTGLNCDEILIGKYLLQMYTLRK